MLITIKKQNQEKFENNFLNHRNIKPILIGRFIDKSEKAIYVSE